ncbi:MAG: HEAT repeat domain-containing protein [Candidatus Omnitrophica bacterium]|nr:HEAT repeat domain-containing protein [Candidatus Omnitrophota bacterium]
MPISSFWSIPKKKKIAAGFLVILIFIFLLVLIVRSCRRPEGESPKKYLQGLAGEIPENRLNAVLGLGRINAKGAVPDLEKVLASDPDERVRRAAAYSILLLDRVKFLNLLNSPDENIRVIGLETISRKEKEKAYPYLEKGLSDPLTTVRRAALALFSQIPGSEKNAVILRLAENATEDSSLRVEALSILSRGAGPDVLDRLNNLADSETDFTVRTAAAVAVKEIKSRKEAGNER